MTLSFHSEPKTVAYCHCADCKRWTGAPLPAFAAFGAGDIQGLNQDPREHTPGVQRWNCAACGSPMAASFDYLPEQIYVPLGILDQAGALAPKLHCHAEHALPWLHLEDDLPRSKGSGRNALNASS